MDLVSSGLIEAMDEKLLYLIDERCIRENEVGIMEALNLSGVEALYICFAYCI